MLSGQQLNSENNIEFEERETLYGNGKIFEQVFYRDGEPAERKTWYEDGQICAWTRILIQGMKHEGKYEVWYKDGTINLQKFSTGGYEVYRFWHKNGRIEQQGSNKYGMRDGQYKFWRRDGQLLMHDFYRSGKLIDPLFSRSRRAFSQVKTYLRNHTYLFDSIIIPDLSRIVCL